MNRLAFVSLIGLALFPASASEAQSGFEADSFPVQGGSLRITFIGHATLMLEVKGFIVHVDPVGRYADYAALPKGDLVLVTHEHSDHLDTAAVDKIRKKGTVIIANPSSARSLPGAVALKNGDSRQVQGITVFAVPAYNTTPERVKFHPPGRDNGYILELGDKRVYIAGDSEDTPEMKKLERIDIAFLPMNLPYTMTPEQVAAAARAFRPKVLYPYHYGDTDASRLLTLLAGEKGIEVRIRKLQ